MSEKQTITFLGAPTNSQLKQSWDPRYSTNQDNVTLSQFSPFPWRRLLNGIKAGDAESPTSYEEALDLSFSQFRDTSMLSEGPTPDLPCFDFDMSRVLDVEDMEHIPSTSKSGKLLYYSLLAGVLHVSTIRKVVTRAGDQVKVVVLTLGDATSHGFELTVWGMHAEYVSKHIRRLDVLLVQDFTLTQFHGTVSGTSRQGTTQFHVLYRVDRQCREDDALRPLLLHDLQSERVRTVRDWMLVWIPVDKEPDCTQDG